MYLLQKFATNKRQPSNAKIPWFLTNLESYYAKEMEAWELARLQKDDSRDSNENGDDLPIEIRHLEENDDMLLIPPLFPSMIGGVTVITFGEEQLSKSKSLNDITKLTPVEKRRMKDHGRSKTCDDPTVPCMEKRLKLEKIESTKSAEIKPELASSCQSVQSTEGSGWLSGSFFENPHFGSLSSLSSAKSAISALSIKSDSGIGSSFSKIAKSDSKKIQRNWCSESQLGKTPIDLKQEDLMRKDCQTVNNENQAASNRTFSVSLGAIQKTNKARSLSTLFKPNLSVQPSEKEKSKTMQSIEGKLMVAIKEVNESDVSETNTPIPSPGLSMPLRDSRGRHKEHRPTLVKQKHSIQAFSFPDQNLIAQQHYKELRKELNPISENESISNPPKNLNSKIEIEITQISVSNPTPKREKKITKQVSLNDEIFYAERQKEKEEIKEKIKRQQSLPEEHLSNEKPKTFRESLIAVTQTKKFEIFRDSLIKFRSSGVRSDTTDQEQITSDPNQSTSLRVGIAKMLHRWKSETEEGNCPKSFTQKKGVNIDPINVFGIRRDQSLDSATRRGLFHKKGAWSPKSPKQQLDTQSVSENPNLLSPTIRRCCMECPEDGSYVNERRLSKGETGSDSSKDSSIQSDTSLDSEDSCISVIFVPHPEGQKIGESSRQNSQSQRSTSNSSESSESPTGRGSPLSPGTKVISPVKIHAKGNSVTCQKTSPSGDAKVPSKPCENSIVVTEAVGVQQAIQGQENEAQESLKLQTPKNSQFSAISALPKIPEHKSFEMEDLPDENPINCHPRAFAERVEIDMNPPLSPHPRTQPSSKYDYPIVRHHPLFAKNQRCRSGTISSLLLGENIEYMRKPGVSLTKGVQSVRKSTPKLLTFEIYNPETDDLDSDSSLSSSPDSGESVVSVISDAKNIDNAKRELENLVYESQNPPPSDDDRIFKFDLPDIQKEVDKSLTDSISSVEQTKDNKDASEIQESIKSELIFAFELEEIERKSEERKKGLMCLLDENKSVLQNINESQRKSDAVEEVSWKTAVQLQSMEELRIPSFSRSASSSPERAECKSEPISVPFKHEKSDAQKQGSLDSLNSLSEQNKPDIACEEPSTQRAETSRPESSSRVSSVNKLKQISRHIEEEIPEIDLESCFSEKTVTSVASIAPVPVQIVNVPIEICVTEHEAEVIEIKPEECPTVHKIESEASTSPIKVQVKSEEAAEQDKSKDVSTAEDFSPKKSKDLSKMRKNSEDKKEEKVPESIITKTTEMDSPVCVPYRRLEKKKRDDSLESNTASIKSSVQLSDTGSLLSHRFSTISISSNVSSDVSFGNTSAVSGSSCYLASMSSADFDDRPALASSFSLSEAEENEYINNQESIDGSKEKETENKLPLSPQIKKDQLSPPKQTAGKQSERPKLKSLFKRSSDGKKNNSSAESRSKSLHSSNESRSRDGNDENSNGKQNRSRIGTFSSLTPETSLEQTTCVEHCSSSFEEELLRSMNNEEENCDDNAFSASDSEDSAEAGGSLTHHRYYHVFREGEIDHIIEKYVENLHIISSYYDHANWCIIAEKVNVWTI